MVRCSQQRAYNPRGLYQSSHMRIFAKRLSIGITAMTLNKRHISAEKITVITLIIIILRIIIIEAPYYGDEHSIFYSTAEFVIKVSAMGLTVYFLAVCISMAASWSLKHESAGATTIVACAAAGLLYVALTTSPAKIHWVIHQYQFNEAIGEMPQSKERLRLEILALKNIDDAPFLPAALDYYVGRSMLIFDSSDQIASPSRSQEWVDAMRAKSGIVANPECHWSIEKIDLHVYAVDAFC